MTSTRMLSERGTDLIVIEEYTFRCHELLKIMWSGGCLRKNHVMRTLNGAEAELRNPSWSTIIPVCRKVR